MKRDPPIDASAPTAPMGMRSARDWAGKGLWAVADRGLFALSNFILNVLLARWLLPDAYGAFALAFSLFLLVATAHTALLAEPMLVFGPRVYRESFQRYLDILLREHWKLSGLLAAGLLVIGAVLWLFSRPVSAAVLAAAAVTPLILLQWLVRQACYVRLQPQIASYAGVGYAVLLVSGAFLLSSVGLLSAVTAFGLMGLSSLAAAAWLTRRLGLQLLPVHDPLAIEARAQHWSYGRWAVSAAMLTWVPGNLYYLLLPIWGGVEGVGTLRALVNLVTPIVHTNVAFSLVLLPALASVRGTSAFTKRLLAAFVVFCSVAALYWVALVYLREPVLHWLYAGQYDAEASILWLLGLLGLATAVVAVAGAALRALERPDRIFWAYVFSSLVAAGTGIVFVSQWQVRGAAMGLVVSSLATAAGLAWYLSREFSQRAESHE